MAKKSPDTTSKKDLVARIRARFDLMATADKDNRRKALEDLRFVNVPGEQWDEIIKRERGERPCYEFNKTRVTIKRVVNDIRANRPQGKVRAVEDGDKDTAEIMEGLCRNIWNVSDGDTIIDAAAEFQVGCGMGAWRVNTKYADDSAFEQDIVIEAIRNPFCLYSDPAAQDFLKRDAEDWILTEKITKKAFERRWPKAEASNFESDEFDDDEEWEDDERVRIAEYWWKEPYTKELWLLDNGMTIDSAEVDPDIGRPVTEADIAAQGLSITKRRSVNCHRIKMAIASGAAILEGPTDWAGTQFPFVQIYGENVVIDGKTHWFGLTRFAKDAQRSYNVTRTAEIEQVATTPQSKYWATAKQAAGHEQSWAEAHKKLYPMMLYTPDPAAPGAPQPMPPAQVPVALIELSRLASEEIKAVTGIFDASLGARSNEQSGIAIRQRQAQGEIATFNYSDNVGKGIRRTWEILLDLIPKYYDTERSVRILGVDGAEKYVKINSVGPDGLGLNDITRGKYDTTVTVGPSFATQRMEASEVYGQMIQANPALFPIIGDLVLKASDLPYAAQMAERVKAMAPPQILALEKDGKPMPPEVTQAMQQAEQMMQQAQAMGQAVQEAAQQVQTDKADADKAKSEVQAAIAGLKVQEANIATDVANFKAMVAETQARMSDTQQTQNLQNEREQLGIDIQGAIAAMQQQLAAYMQQASDTLAQIMARTQPQVIVPPKPRIVRMESERVNGRLVAIPIYEDQINPGAVN